MRMISLWLTIVAGFAGQRCATFSHRDKRVLGSYQPALRRLVLVLILGLLLVSWSPSAQATTPDYTQEPAPSAVVVEHARLTPDSSVADAHAEAALEFIRYANGATEIAGSVTYDADG